MPKPTKPSDSDSPKFLRFVDPTDPTKLMQIGLSDTGLTTGDGLNYAGYRWNSPTEGPVDSVTTRIDVQLGPRQSVFGRYSNAWRNDLINDIINTTPRPMSWPARVRISDQQG